MIILPILSLTSILSAILAFCLTTAIRPALIHYALAKPNSRSSHKIPVPQGGGAAVIVATLAVLSFVMTWRGIEITPSLKIVFAATLFIAAIGAIDDFRVIPVLPRLICQALAVGAVLITVPANAQIVTQCPLWLERSLLLIAGVWFVNLVNFMDGLDWMTVAETIPVAGTLAVFGIAGHVQPATALTMTALTGAMIGFAPFNRPVAKLFLGDVGSLPIGLLLGWALLELAVQGHVAAALLLPLYYLADATITILRRTLNRERIWTGHRTHFYQRATDNGFAVIQVIATVFALNLVLAALALATIFWTTLTGQFTLLLCGVAAVTKVLARFGRSRGIPTKARHGID